MILIVNPGLVLCDVHNIRCLRLSKPWRSLTPLGDWKLMKQFLLSTPAQLVIWLSVLAVLVAIGGFIVGRLRGRADDERQTANEMLSNFREMHEQGGIDQAEFRNIKTVLGVKLQQELNVSVGQGLPKTESSGGLSQEKDSKGTDGNANA